MRIVALEEHVVVPSIVAAWGELPDVAQTPELGFGDSPLAARLRDTGAGRLAEMDDQGVDLQVLSVSTPGAQNLPRASAASVARAANDELAAIVAGHPDRYQAFATVPTPDPEAVAEELERAVGVLGFRGVMLNGRTGAANVDDVRFRDLHETAERLRAPIYLHPQVPPVEVRTAYYSGLGDEVDFAFARMGLGWFYETGVQLCRLILSGTFDRCPELQVVVGHWGEVVLFAGEHLAKMQRMGLHLERPLAEYFRQNVWVTGSGLLSERYLRWAIEVVGVERIMHATDHPFVPTGGGQARSFLEDAPLPEADKQAIASGNWERLTAHLSPPTR